MSKVEVKVKNGDRWTTSSGMLFQVRGDMDQIVVNDVGYVYRTEDDYWEKITVSREMVPEEIARMWVEHFGGTVVEEEAAPTPGTQYVYQHTSGKLRFYTKPQPQLQAWVFVGTVSLPIAGVT